MKIKSGLFVRIVGNSRTGGALATAVNVCLGLSLLAGIAPHAQASGVFGICVSNSAYGTDGYSSGQYANNFATTNPSCSPNGLTSFIATPGATVTPSSFASNLTTASIDVASPTSGGGVTNASSASSLDQAALRVSGDTTTLGPSIANEYAGMVDTLTFGFLDGATSAIIGITASLDGTISGGVSPGQYSLMEVFSVGGGQACFTTSGGGNPPSDGACTTGNGGFATSSFTNITATGFTFNGTFIVTPGEMSSFIGVLTSSCAGGADCDFSNTAAFSLTLPSDVTLSSASGVFGTQSGGSVPEPGTLSLLGLGLLGIVSAARRGARSRR